MSISIEIADPPLESSDDNAKMLETAEGVVQQVISEALTEGVFGVIPGSWFERKTQNQRHRVFQFQVIAA